jgi:type IV pilus assembly protein PilM
MLRENLRAENGVSRVKPGSTRKSADNAGKLDASTQQVMIDAMSSVAENLAKEISLCLRYYTVTFRGKRVQRATFAGGGAYESILLDVLRSQLSVEIDLAEPFRGFDLSSAGENVHFEGDRRGRLCEWAVAVGLSLKGWNNVDDGRSKPNKQAIRQL